MQPSSFILQDTLGKSSDFERIDTIESNSSTCDCYIVTINGKSLFMKRLKDEYASNATYRSLLTKEFETANAIDHNNIVKHHSINDDENGYYILMENIAGTTLDKFITNHPQYFQKRANLDKFFNQLLDALKCLHENHVVHSDLKPQNIMLTQVNNDVKLIDFGFCFVDAYSHTVGTTPNFAAPEHNDISQIDATTDIYCIGRLIEYIDSYSAKPIPRMYQSIMNKCLKPDKNDRYQQVGEIIHKINSHKKRNIVLSVAASIVLIIVASLFMTTFPSSVKSDISIDTLRLNHIKYSNFNEATKTCAAVGCTDIPNLYFEEKIEHKGETYLVTEITDSAFINRIDIVTIHFPHGIKRIGKYAFQNCKGLTALILPNSITEIGPWAFWGCDSIKRLKLSSNLTEIPTACFAGFSCKSFSIPEGIKKINVDAFSQNGFLQSVTLPSTLKVLEPGVFYNNHHLEEVTIPANIEIIGEYQFFGCKKLTHIYNLSPTPQPIVPIHRNPSQITVHVPAESVDAYKNAPYWQDMNIVAIED